MAYAVHQAARFCENPKESHTNAVHRIVRYLAGTKDQGLILNPKEPLFECYADADFCGLWNKERAEKDATTANSRTGYIIFFAKCALIWASKLQSEITLSTTESEYVAFSQALRDVLPLIALLRELRNVIPFGENAPVLHCTVHEDNKGCIDLIETPRIRPRTKHIALKYHHFRSHVKDGTISVKYIETTEQIADIFTKALGDVQFGHLRKKFMGW